MFTRYVTYYCSRIYSILWWYCCCCCDIICSLYIRRSSKKCVEAVAVYLTAALENAHTTILHANEYKESGGYTIKASPIPIHLQRSTIQSTSGIFLLVFLFSLEWMVLRQHKEKIWAWVKSNATIPSPVTMKKRQSTHRGGRKTILDFWGKQHVRMTPKSSLPVTTAFGILVSK